MKNFKTAEFDSPDEKGSGCLMDREFLQMLDKARDIAGVPFKITSGYRSYSHNRKVGGVPKSSHRLGMACDIACSNSRHRFKIVNALMLAGFNRIGIAKNFIHVDNDMNKSSEVIWTY